MNARSWVLAAFTLPLFVESVAAWSWALRLFCVPCSSGNEFTVPIRTYVRNAANGNAEAKYSYAPISQPDPCGRRTPR